jgi:prepilin-type N-terminal cleavage/methylation domain-containing protein/prepilin-type processing-associated H-X9-DG protein
MTFRKCRGFTLIELLVVIAIIGILAAMLFPVFARARESARKTQCLANVKNIAMGINLYLTDYDAMPPGDVLSEDASYFAGNPGGALGSSGGTDCDKLGTSNWAARANPYLRWPVVLDEYIKSRDIWRCPSAKMQSGATFIVNGTNWLAYYRANEGSWGGGWSGVGPCYSAWPNGWGGAVTDSAAQQTLATSQTAIGSAASSDATNSFLQSIGIAAGAGTKLSAVGNTAGYVVCGDSGSMAEIGSIGMLAYPEICCMECTGVWGWPPSVDDYCGSCGDCYYYHANMKYHTDPDYRKTAARHMGGVNVGYLDGHAQWTTSEGLCAQMRDDKLEGIAARCPTREYYTENCGDPTGIYFIY